jgi:hypothetical protein
MRARSLVRPVTDCNVCRHRVPSVDVCLVDSEPPSLEQHVLLHHHRGLASLGSMYADEADAESPQRLEHFARAAAHADNAKTPASSCTAHADAIDAQEPAAGGAPARVALANATTQGLKGKNAPDNTVKPPGHKSGATNAREKRDDPSRNGRHAANRGGRGHTGGRPVALRTLPRSGQDNEQGGGQTAGRGADGSRDRQDARKSGRKGDGKGDAAADYALQACAQALARLMVSLCAQLRAC